MLKFSNPDKKLRLNIVLRGCYCRYPSPLFKNHLRYFRFSQPATMLFHISYDFDLHRVQQKFNLRCPQTKNLVSTTIHLVDPAPCFAPRKMAEQGTCATTDVCSEWGNEDSDNTSDFLTSEENFAWRLEWPAFGWP